MGWARTLGLTLLGLAVVWLALRGSAVETQPAVTQAELAPSSRGQRVAGRAPVSFEEQMAVTDLSHPSPTPTQTGVAATPTPQAPTATLTPTPAPTLPRTRVTTYKVQAGDNVWTVAQRFGISQDTVIWANNLEWDPDLLTIGQELYILPTTGVWHTVKEGETLGGIARYYKVDPQKILDYAPNGLDPEGDLVPGSRLIIPGGAKPYAPKTVITDEGVITLGAQTGRFVWPVHGTVTTTFGPSHKAIDIANDMDTPVYAADAGTVVQAGANGSLGIAVTVDHGGGLTTVYGHLDYLWVREGQRVERGHKIGGLGSTGRSTGPHVHLIVLYQNVPVDPMLYLPH